MPSGYSLIAGKEHDKFYRLCPQVFSIVQCINDLDERLAGLELEVFSSLQLYR